MGNDCHIDGRDHAIHTGFWLSWDEFGPTGSTQECVHILGVSGWNLCVDKILDMGHGMGYEPYSWERPCNLKGHCVELPYRCSIVSQLKT